MTRQCTLGSLAEASGAQLCGDARRPVTGVEHDSRAVRPGALFVALPGAKTDGHLFIPQALRAGAGAIAVASSAALDEGVDCLRLPDTRRALPALAAHFWGQPGRELTLIGVTGTNGKSSTVRMLETILDAAGRRAGSVGTISARCGAFERPASLTTPEASDLQKLLREMRDAAVDHVALEVSSHALSSGRVQGLRFAVAAFTNLTQDHLDYHGDMESYAASKGELFGPSYLAGTAVLNAGDPRSADFASRAERAGAQVLFFGRGADTRADLRTTRESLRLGGSSLEIETPNGPLEVELPHTGSFQIDNALAAAGASLALGIPLGEIRAGLEKCPPVPGRLERVALCQPTVLVDYAHTPDALDRMLASLRPICAARLICVFGCGGDRDRGKRAPMARSACAHADHVIATSDNPRTEDPQAILDDVAEGLRGNFEILVDRRAAIDRAISLAEPEDLVVIAGKGHEDYQILGTQRVAFDDRECARNALRARGVLQ